MLDFQNTYCNMLIKDKSIGNSYSFLLDIKVVGETVNYSVTAKSTNDNVHFKTISGLTDINSPEVIEESIIKAILDNKDEIDILDGLKREIKAEIPDNVAKNPVTTDEAFQESEEDEYPNDDDDIQELIV